MLGSQVGNNCLSEEVAPPGFLDDILDSPEVSVANVL